MPAPGWPTDDELAQRLGLALGAAADPGNVAMANAEAAADAVYHGAAAGTVDPEAGAVNDAVYGAILDLGVIRYQSRNRPSDFATQGPFAVNAPSRIRAIQILQQGKVAIA